MFNFFKTRPEPLTVYDICQRLNEVHAEREIKVRERIGYAIYHSIRRQMDHSILEHKSVERIEFDIERIVLDFVNICGDLPELELTEEELLQEIRSNY